MFGWCVFSEPDERPSALGIVLSAAWGALFLGLAALILIRPEIVAYLAAGVAAAIGLSLLGAAVAAVWDAWRRRPRRIKIRTVR
jgi:hypothetical protein